MKLQIDFFGKRAVSIFIEFNAQETRYGQEDSELLLFAWYTIRQFSNMGHNPATNAIARLIAWDQAIVELIKDQPKLPSAIDFMSPIPRIVHYQGRPGNKQFIADIGEYPPYILHLKGLGFFSWGTNYYVGYSIVALFRFLMRRHSSNQTYLKRLSFIAKDCVEAYGINAISMSNVPQMKLANQIVEKSESVK
jgi:hypothetical protein